MKRIFKQFSNKSQASTFQGSASKVGWEILGDLIQLLSITKESLGGAGPLQGAVGGPAELLRIFEAQHKNRDGIREINSEISHLWQAVIDPLRNASITSPDIQISGAVLGRITKLKINLDEVRHDLEIYRNRNYARQLLSNKEVTQALTGAAHKIKAATDEFLLEGSVINQIQIDDVQDNARLNRLDRLPRSASAHYNSPARAFAPTCHNGTRKPLLKQIRDWITDVNSQPVFWLIGSAGMGKSTIAKTVCQCMNDRHILGASFFFSRDESDRNHPFLFFPTIAYQLGHFDISFRHQISESLRVSPGVGEGTMQQQLRTLIVDPLSRVPPRSNPVVVVVIDALDEGGKGAEVILHLLIPQISRFSFRLKILVTSRALPTKPKSIGSSMSKPIFDFFGVHYIEETMSREDIELFLRDEFKSISEDMLGGIQWPSEDEIAELVRRASSLWIYASTLVQFIRNDDWRNPRHQLSVLLSEDGGRSSSLLEDIDKLYFQVLREAITDTRDAALCSRFRQVVGTIILLQDPLSVLSVATLLEMEMDNLFAAVSKLRAVLIIPNVEHGSYKSIRVLHPSFPEFLTDPLRCTDKAFFIDKREHHQGLALYCLQLMISFLQRDICDIRDISKPNPKVEDLHKHISHNLEYACRYWVYHLQLAPGESTDSVIIEQLKVFCSKKLLYWVEVLCLFCSLEMAIPAIEVVLQWRGMDHSLSDILESTRQLILLFSDAMEVNATRLYSPECVQFLKNRNMLLYEQATSGLAARDLPIFQPFVQYDSSRLIRLVKGPIYAGLHTNIYLGELTREDGTEKVALRTLRGSRAGGHITKEFRRDLEIWRSLKHSYLLPFYGSWEPDENTFYLVSAWAEGGNILDYLLQNPSINRSRLLWQTSSALAYLHSDQARVPIVHGDIRAEKILISTEGDALLCNFALSRTLYSHDMMSTRGTLRFMAPELFQIEGDVSMSTETPKSDVFSFASMMLQVYTERLPFADIPEAEAVLKLTFGELSERPSDPIVTQRGCNDEVWNLMMECWNMEPDKRPCMDVVTALLEKAL